MPGGLASQARGVALRDRCRGCIEGRRVFRGGTVSMGRMVSLGVLDWNVLSRLRGGLARQFTGLMAYVVAKCVPATLVSEARGQSLSATVASAISIVDASFAAVP